MAPSHRWRHLPDEQTHGLQEFLFPLCDWWSIVEEVKAEVILCWVFRLWVPVESDAKVITVTVRNLDPDSTCGCHGPRVQPGLPGHCQLFSPIRVYCSISKSRRWVHFPVAVCISCNVVHHERDNGLKCRYPFDFQFVFSVFGVQLIFFDDFFVQCFWLQFFLVNVWWNFFFSSVGRRERSWRDSTILKGHHYSQLDSDWLLRHL
jgi:hypothetical protein